MSFNFTYGSLNPFGSIGIRFRPSLTEIAANANKFSKLINYASQQGIYAKNSSSNLSLSISFEWNKVHCGFDRARDRDVVGLFDST